MILAANHGDTVTEKNVLLQIGRGKFICPGFGDNFRVLKWIIGRLNGTARAKDTVIGRVPSEGELDTDGLKFSEGEVGSLLSVDLEDWRHEALLNRKYLALFGDRLPETLGVEQGQLEARLGLPGSG